MALKKSAFILCLVKLVWHFEILWIFKGFLNMDDVHHHKNELTSIKNPSQFTIFLNIDLRIHRKIPGQKIVNWENLLYSSKKRNRLKNCYSISYQWIKSLKMFFINVKVEKIFFLLLLLQWRAQKGWLCHQSSTFYVACTSPNVWIQTYFFGIPMSFWPSKF